MSVQKTSSIFAAVMLVAGAATAVPLPADIFTGLDPDALATLPLGILVTTPRANFQSKLTNTVSSYGFEDLVYNSGAPATTGTGTLVGSAGNFTATITGGSLNSKPIGSDDFGRFNTTAAGKNFWQGTATAASATAFTITFSKAIASFGFYATDINDFGGTLQLLLTPSAGGPDVSLTVLDATSPAGANGDALFYGFIDRAVTYSKITFVTGGASRNDLFGIDDITAGDLAQIAGTIPTTVPEPTSLALAGLALGAAGLAGRMSRRRA